MRPGEPGRREVLQRVRRTRRWRPAAAARSGGSVRALRRPRRVHVARREARPEDVRAFLVRTTSASVEIEREPRRTRREVRRRRGHGRLRRAGHVRRRRRAAVRAAFAVRDWAEPEGLQLRVAVNTGEAIVALEASPERGETFVAGDVVNTAARLQSASPVGAVLVGEETYIGTRGSIEYRPAQPVLAKGKEAPVQAWLAVRPIAGIGERPVAARRADDRPRPRARRAHEHLGARRRREPEPLRHGLRPGRASGSRGSRSSSPRSSRGRTARRSADARRRTARAARTARSASRSSRSRRSSTATTSTTRARSSPRRSAARGAQAAEEHAPNLAVLLGLDAESEIADREQLFFSARVLVESLALRTPTLLAVRGHPLGGRSLLDLLETLASRVRDVPVLIVALARPELLGERPGWGGGLPAYTALPLEPLSDGLQPRAGASFCPHATARAGQRPSRRPRRAIHCSSRSSPRRSASRRSRGSRAADEHPRDHRREARRAAGRGARRPRRRIGRRPVFWRGALAEMATRDDLSALLGSLEARDFVQREAVSRIQGDQQFAFKHGLIHDVAYETLPRAARRERTRPSPLPRGEHRRRPVARGPRPPLARAGENERAAEHLIAAGDQAGRGWAKGHAVTLYREALELLGDDDARRRDVNCDSGSRCRPRSPHAGRTSHAEPSPS